MNMKAKVLVGVSAAGKSTYAKALCLQGYVALDRDDLRFSLCKVQDWSQYTFDHKVERMITNAHDAVCKVAALGEVNIVIAETNLTVKTRNKWKEKLTQLGYDVEFVPVHIDLEEAVKRNKLRDNGLPEDVIRYKQWPKWVEFLETLEV